MNQFRLLHLLGTELPSSDAEKLHSALFLAQWFTGERWYDFELQRGRVRSSELDSELALVYTTGLSRVFNPSRLPAVATDRRPVDRLCHRLSWLLSQPDDVVEAAATSAFFAAEHLGNPASKLRWYRALPPGVLRKASSLEADVRAQGGALETGG